MSSFRYSRWDGTQQIMPFDADAIMDALSDDILAHGDIKRALEKLMQQGHRFQSGEKMPGLRDLLDRIKQSRQDTLRHNNMDSVVNDIRQRLEKIKEAERTGIDRRVEEGREQAQATQQQSDPGEGTEPAAENTSPPSPEQTEMFQKMLEQMANRHREQLDNLPSDLAGQVKGLKEYDFMDPDARQQFQELLDSLQQQMVQNTFSGLQEGMQKMQTDPKAMEAMREMVHDLNKMLRDHQEGRDPHFNEFMQKHGHNFPPGIENIDQLLEHLQQQMQRMENMMESMSSQQRAELQGMMEGLMQDAGLQAEMQELAEQLGMLMPMGGGRQYRFSGDADDALSMSEAMQVMEQLDELEKLERELNAARRGESLDDIDRERMGELLGADAQQALDQLRELAKQLEDAGYLEWKGDEMQLTPRATRKLGQKALEDIFSYLKRDAFGKHPIGIRGRGGERTYDSKPYEFGDPFELDLRATLGNALARQGSGTPVKLVPADFDVHSTEFMTQSSTVLLIDMSRSMLLRGCFMAAKKVALALNHLIRSQFPKDDLYIVGFSGVARELKPEQLPQLDWSEYQYGTNLQHALMLSRQLLGRRNSPNKQVIVITDGEPTAHLEDGDVFFNYPPTFRTIQETLREVVRCTRDRIVINTFMLERSYYMADFVEQMTKINKGRAFYATPEALGEYILVDYVASKTKRLK
jgi:uncharacterized protein with von Willebrand factor type A (vWA) domain